MPGDADVAATAALIADPGRARMLFALADGRALPAGVLAAEAEVAPSTASGHLARLLEAGLLVAERHGRHRYFRVAGPEVVRVLEALARISPPRPVRSLRQGTRAQQVRAARLCYDHVAGRGERLLRDLGVDLPALRAGRRPVVRYCLDWSEQRHHLAGSLGAALADRMLELDWVRRSRSSRALAVTDAGRAGLRDRLGVAVP